VSIEFERDYRTEVERAQAETKGAVERARLIVERSRALLLGQPAAPTARPQTDAEPLLRGADETFIQAEAVVPSADESQMSPAMSEPRAI